MKVKTYTNDNTDLACTVYKIYWRYDDGSVKARYELFNKKNGIIYERKKGKINVNMFRWCYLINKLSF